MRCSRCLEWQQYLAFTLPKANTMSWLTTWRDLLHASLIGKCGFSQWTILFQQEVGKCGFSQWTILFLHEVGKCGFSQWTILFLHEVGKCGFSQWTILFLRTGSRKMWLNQWKILFLLVFSKCFLRWILRVFTAQIQSQLELCPHPWIRELRSPTKLVLLSLHLCAFTQATLC